MGETVPLDFLLARAARVVRRAQQLRRENAIRRSMAVAALQRAGAAQLRAHLFAAYATDLQQHSHTLLNQRPPLTLDEGQRARLAHDELWRRRLAKRLARRRWEHGG